MVNKIDFISRTVSRCRTELRPSLKGHGLNQCPNFQLSTEQTHKKRPYIKCTALQFSFNKPLIQRIVLYWAQ